MMIPEISKRMCLRQQTIEPIYQDFCVLFSLLFFLLLCVGVQASFLHRRYNALRALFTSFYSLSHLITVQLVKPSCYSMRGDFHPAAIRPISASSIPQTVDSLLLFIFGVICSALMSSDLKEGRGENLITLHACQNCQSSKLKALERDKATLSLSIY